MALLRLFGKPSANFSYQDSGPIGMNPFTWVVGAMAGDIVYSNLSMNSYFVNRLTINSFFRGRSEVDSVFSDRIEVQGHA